MKALQDKLKAAETEITEMRRVVDNYEQIKQDALAEQKRKFDNELQSCKEKELHLQKNIEKLHHEADKLRDDINKLQTMNRQSEDEITNLKIQISRFKEEINHMNQE